MSNFMRTRHVRPRPRPAYFQPRDLLRNKPWREMQDEWAATKIKDMATYLCLITALAIIAAVLVAGGM